MTFVGNLHGTPYPRLFSGNTDARRAGLSGGTEPLADQTRSSGTRLMRPLVLDVL